MLKKKNYVAFILSMILVLMSLQFAPPVIAEAKSEFGLSGMAHVQSIGNQNASIQQIDGIDTLVLGTRGMSKRVEEITVNLANNSKYSGSLQYRVHVQRLGWSDWVDAGSPAGSRGMSYRLEGIEMRLTGDLAKHYSVRYAVHIQSYGDAQGWVYDGGLAGTTGESKRLEEVKVQIVPRSSLGDTPNLSYRVHRQTYGWENVWANSGSVSGTTGQSKRLEGITIAVNNSKYQGGIEYQTHIQSIGWESEWASNGRMSGTNGRALRLEAIRIRLTGDLANNFSVYYRVHAQHFGWMGWAKDGADSGTAGFAYRLEAIQIVLVPKGSSAPGSNYGGIVSTTDQPFISKDSQPTPGPTPEPTPGEGNADTNGWVPYYNYDPSRGCYMVKNGYRFERDSSSIMEDDDVSVVNNMVAKKGNEIQYKVLENKANNQNGYKLGDYRKFSYKIRNNPKTFIFDYLKGKDVENALVKGTQLSTYKKDGKEEYYKYSYCAVPNYKNAIIDIEEKVYDMAANPSYVGPSYATYQLRFPKGCVDGELTIDVYYDKMIIDTFKVVSTEGTRYKKLYDLVKSRTDSSMSTHKKLTELYEIICWNYYCNCIGGADLFYQAARHFWGLPAAFTMNKVGFEDDENVNEPCVVNTGSFLGDVGFYYGGYINNKMIKNVSYTTMGTYKNNCGLYYTHLATVIYYDGMWHYWDAQGFNPNPK